jgi:hypothetical protein
MTCAPLECTLPPSEQPSRVKELDDLEPAVRVPAQRVRVLDELASRATSASAGGSA